MRVEEGWGGGFQAATSPAGALFSRKQAMVRGLFGLAASTYSGRISCQSQARALVSM